MKNRLLILSMAIITIFSLTLNSTLALGLSPSKTVKTLNPGETTSIVIKLENITNKISNLTVQKADILKSTHTEGWDYFIEGIDDPTAYSLRNWLSISEDYTTPFALNPGENAAIPVTITVPEDASPGLHQGAVLINETPTNAEGQGGIKYGFRIVSIIQITVTGDVHEDLELIDFKLDEDRFAKGDIVFNTTTNNKGSGLIAVQGKIEILDKNSKEQITKIDNLIEKTNGIEKIVGTADFIPVTSHTLVPEEKQIHSTVWKNRTIGTGEYIAKLTIFYGLEETELNAELDFIISENLTIKNFSSDKKFYWGLPVKFFANIQNHGTKELNPRSILQVKNIFGVEKMSVDLNPETLNIAGGETLNILNGLEWSEGLAVGFYTANLKVTYGETNQLITKSFGFWVLNWWQIGLILIVILIISFVLIKTFKGYAALKKKLIVLENHESKND